MILLLFYFIGFISLINYFIIIFLLIGLLLRFLLFSGDFVIILFVGVRIRVVKGKHSKEHQENEGQSHTYGRFYSYFRKVIKAILSKEAHVRQGTRERNENLFDVFMFIVLLIYLAIFLSSLLKSSKR